MVEPGLVLDELNRALKPHGLWFPVDVSTASRATIGGMAANNSCGARSIRYGQMRDNVHAIDALMADGNPRPLRPRRARRGPSDGPVEALVRDMLALGAREADEIEARFPKLLRRVGGYNIDALVPAARQQPRAPAGRLGGHAGAVRPRSRSRLSPLPPRQGRVACATSPPSATRWRRRSTSWPLGPDRGGAGRPTMIELGRDDPDALARARRASCGATRRRCCSWSSPRTTADENRRRLAAAARRDGRSRLRLRDGGDGGRRGRGARRRASRAPSPRSARRASTS